MGNTEDGTLDGPDFTEGWDLDKLADGESVLGHANGDAVLLVNDGGSVRAVSAKCTHYGGPLDEGVVHDGTVRCPWHHAKFELADGSPSAPAHDPLSCYAVEVADGTVTVGEKIKRAEPPRPTKQPQSVVIVGAGAAGAACAETLRRSGYKGPIHVIAGDAEFPVDRPNLSKDFLAGDAPADWLPVHGADFYAEHDIELVSARATSIDREYREVRLDDGSTLPFDALLLATGASPRTLGVPGADRPHVHTLRSLGDAKSLVDDAKDGGRAVVIGGSFIGLEAAASLRKRGLDVVVIDPASIPLAHVLGDEVGRAIQSIHESRGVEFRMESNVASIGEDEVMLEDGTSIPADVVVVGIGVEPRTELAESAGLRVDDGVFVSEMLRADDRIFVAGDIARFPYNGSSARIEHWAVAERQGQVAAKNMLGAEQAFKDVPFFWSRHFDESVSYVGHTTDWDEVKVSGSLDDRDATIAYWSDGHIAAVATMGRPEVSMMAEIAMEQGDASKLEALVAR